MLDSSIPLHSQRCPERGPSASQARARGAASGRRNRPLRSVGRERADDLSHLWSKRHRARFVRGRPSEDREPSALGEGPAPAKALIHPRRVAARDGLQGPRAALRARDPPTARQPQAVLRVPLRALRETGGHVPPATAAHAVRARGGRRRRGRGGPPPPRVRVPGHGQQLPRRGGRGAAARGEPRGPGDRPPRRPHAQGGARAGGPLHAEARDRRVEHGGLPAVRPDRGGRRDPGRREADRDPHDPPGGGRRAQGLRGGGGGRVPPRPPGRPARRGLDDPGRREPGGGRESRPRDRLLAPRDATGAAGDRDDPRGPEHLHPRRGPHRDQGRAGAADDPGLRGAGGRAAVHAPRGRKGPQGAGRRPRGPRDPRPLDHRVRLRVERDPLRHRRRREGPRGEALRVRRAPEGEAGSRVRRPRARRGRRRDPALR